MNLERTKPETLAAGVMDYMPQSLAAHEYAERLNAALARLGLTDRLTLPPAPNTAIDELPAVVDVPLRKTLSVLMGKAQQGDASALATLEMTAQVMESIFAGLHARASVYPLALPSDESLATLPQGVDALLPRKISTGWSVASLLADPTCDGIDDGVNLVRLLCSAAADSVTELKDDNEGWVMTKEIANAFPSAIKATINCKRLLAPVSSTIPNAEDLEFPFLEEIDTSAQGHIQRNMFYGNIRRINMPEVKKLHVQNASYNGVFYNILTPCEILTPNCTYVSSAFDNNYPRLFHTTSGVYKWVLGTITYANNLLPNGDFVNLIHLEFGQGTSVSLKLNWWTATNVLSDSERLPIFLSNFKTYIAERLSEQGSGLTITLSQAVRDAIQQDPEIVTIITSKGWTISPAPSV